ncbi:MAG: adenylate/guanylate cyclase domain-containing protein [Azospirillaceae bacterium]
MVGGVEIEAWLETLGLSQYATAFRDNQIDREVLAHLTADDLKDLGIDAVGHRRKLLTAIADLARDEVETPAPASPAPRMPAPSPSPGDAQHDGERRYVAVLFADLTGFTRLTEAIGAEAMHDVLNTFFTRVDAIVERMGGRVDKHIGDCVMGVFGAPVARGNDAERAILAAMEIRRAMPDIAREAGHRIDVHIGVTTGIVIASYVGAGATAEYAVTGESVNLASRLSDAAETGEILISDGLKRALEDRFSFEPAGILEVKGLAAPVAAWRVETVSAQPGRRGTFVGRSAERRQFTSILRDCLENQAGHVVVLRGEAGLGKTRLSEEFERKALEMGFAPHRGLVLDFGAETGRDAIRAIIREILDIDPHAPADASAMRIERLVGEGRIPSHLEVHLYDLLNVGKPERLEALYDAMDDPRRQHGRGEAISAILDSAARRTPLLLIVEDVHWAKPPLLRALAHMAQAIRDLSAILLVTTRVEGDPVDRAWRALAAGPSFMTLDLTPLRAEEARQVCESTLADAPLIEGLVERAGGNPLFLEQLLRHARSGDPDSVPGTIQSLVQATVDKLSPVDRRTIEAASVIGQRVDTSLVAHLTGSQHVETAQLIEKNLLRPHGGDFIFVHALIRDAVYVSLLGKRRRDLHDRAAIWFRSRDLRLCAEHLALAGSAAAAQAFRVAAEEELGKYHYETALGLIERGLSVSTDAAEGVRLLLLEGQSWHDFGRMAEAQRAFARALEIAAEPLDRCRARIGLASVKRVTEDIDGALEDLETARLDIRDSEAPTELARICFLRGNLQFPRGRFDDCLREHEAGLRFARLARRPDLEAASLGGLGDAEYVRGRMASAKSRLEACVALAAEQGLGRIAVANRAQIAHTLHYAGSQQEAHAMACRAIEEAAQVGHSRAEINANAALLKCLFAMRRFEACLEAVQRYEKLVERIGALRFRQVAHLVTSRSLHGLGQREAAEAAALAGVAFAKETGYAFHGPAMSSAAAVIATEPARKHALTQEALRGVADGCVGHNQFSVYADGISVAFDLGDEAMLESFIEKAEGFPGDEEVAWSGFHVLRGRALLSRLRSGGTARSEALCAAANQRAEELMLLAWPIG